MRVGGARLLAGFSAQFAARELVMVVGPNGAGKTTLLRALSGERAPSDGRVTLAGRALSQWRALELARARAVLPQNSTLDFPFSVTDVVLMGRMPHTTSDAENRAIATQTLEACDCAHLTGAAARGEKIFERAYTQLSGGEQQRVQIARVLAQVWSTDGGGAHERFLLLDEPVAALDWSHQYALLRGLKNLCARENIGVVCTLHDLNLVAQFADRVIVLDGGKKVADGAPRAVFSEDLLRRVFHLEVAVRPHPDATALPLLIPRLPNS